MADSFEFFAENLSIAKKITDKYEASQSRSAILELLHLAQKQHGYISSGVIDYLSRYLSLSKVQIMEVVSFYSMFFQKKMGKYVLQFCGTTPCMLRGAEQVLEVCKNKLGLQNGQSTTDDMLFSVQEVECLGACIGAPVMQINNENYVENLDQEKIISLIDELSSTNHQK